MSDKIRSGRTGENRDAIEANWPFPERRRPTEINVRDIGAKGDGVTDDAAAFQAAVDAAIGREK